MRDELLNTTAKMAVPDHGADIIDVLTKATVDIATVARVLGISKNAAYKARESGDIPSIKVGSQFRVPTAKLREMLGLPVAPPSVVTAPPVQQAA